MPDNRMLNRVFFGTVQGHNYQRQLSKPGINDPTELMQHDITTESCKVEDSHSCRLLRFLNHGTRSWVRCITRVYCVGCEPGLTPASVRSMHRKRFVSYCIQPAGCLGTYSNYSMHFFPVRLRLVMPAKPDGLLSGHRHAQ